MYRNLILRVTIPWIVSMALIGCDKQSTEVAREAADRQAQQNITMAELQQEVATGTKSLVEADARAREEVIGVHRDLLAERSRLDIGWADLEHERQHLAKQRRTESLLVPALQTAGLLAVVALVLGFSWYVIARASYADESGDDIRELLLNELATNPSFILPEELGSPPLVGDSQTDPQRNLVQLKETKC